MTIRVRSRWRIQGWDDAARRSAGYRVSRALDLLRPHPHRGDVIAAGAVPLALAAIVIELRMTQWSLGTRFVVTALIVGLLLTLGWLAELEGAAPRAYHSVLLVAGLLPLAAALVLLAEVLGARRPPGAGGFFWIFAAEGAVATTAARRANSGVCTLISAIAAGVAVQAFVIWVFKPHGGGTFRAMLLVLTLAFVVAATRLRDRRRRHAVQLVNAAGLTALALAASYALLASVTTISAGPGGTIQRTAASGVPFGWKLYLFAVGAGLVAYAAADQEPGPAYIGTAILVSFALFAGLSPLQRGSLVGWPLFLLVIGGAGLAIGLRPRQPLPPEPPSPTGASGAPTVPLHPVDGE
jgi:hypothetical protein